MVGASVPEYDFALPGVRSICTDIHKLGYSNKGVSAFLLRDAQDEQYHRFTFSAWPS
jgi:glutamate/tyrosine decarboxylase-like PLP-dependent enzyme